MASKTAQQALNENLAEARAHLARIAAELDNLEREAAARPRDWGFAGSAGKVAGDLADTARFLGAKVDEVA